MGTRTIICDTRQHAGKHDNKMGWWERHGVPTVQRALDFGDYATDGSNVVVDTKRSLDELCANLCGKAREHNRVRREMERARDAGCRLVFLVECVDVQSIDDVRGWTHTHCKRCYDYNRRKCDPRDRKFGCARHGTRKPSQGDVLAKVMETMSQRYRCVFEFANPRDSARRICELLGVGYDDDE